MKGFRADLLRFADQGVAELLTDAVMVVDQGLIVEVGDAVQMLARYPHLLVQHFPGKIIAPGFVDLHVHYPQLDVIGSPASGLLPWLEDYTFPQESRFGDPEHAAEVAQAFIDQLLLNGVTTASVYCTAHEGSVHAFMGEASKRGLRMIAGKSMQDRHSPPALTDDTAASLAICEALIEQWHGHGRLGYAITPRFAPSCTDEQMRGMGALALKYPDVWLQTHVAENLDEIAWAKQLYPQARSYLDVYESFGMLRPRSVYAHCIWLDDTDRKRLQATGSAIAVCPTSNLFLGSGLFDFAKTDAAQVVWGLASDVGGGSSFSPFKTMFAAYQIARLQGQSLDVQKLWWHHTAGAAKALGLDTHVGNLAAGLEADAIVLDPRATSLGARRFNQARSLDEKLFALMALGDDRLVARCIIGGTAQ
jgi:guanine deaminase